MLAYVFWHRPGGGVDRGEYERGLRAFHAELDCPSASAASAPTPARVAI